MIRGTESVSGVRGFRKRHVVVTFVSWGTSFVAAILFLISHLYSHSFDQAKFEMVKALFVCGTVAAIASGILILIAVFLCIHFRKFGWIALITMVELMKSLFLSSLTTDVAIYGQNGRWSIATPLCVKPLFCISVSLSLGFLFFAIIAMLRRRFLSGKGTDDIE